MALEILKEAHLILITGAGGGLGRYVVAELGGKGLPGIAVVRSAFSTSQGKVSFFTGDLKNRAWLETLFQEFPFQKIVHLAWKREGGVTRVKGGYGENRQITRNLLELGRYYQVPSFVFASSLNVGLSCKNQYAREKEEAEKMISASEIPQKVIYRLSSLFGIGVKAYWNSLARSAMKRRIIFLMGRSPLHFQPLYAGEAARVVLEEREAGTYYLVGPEILSDEDLVRSVERLRGVRLKIFRLPIKAISRLMTPWAQLITPFRCIQEEIKALNQDKVYSGPEALKGSTHWEDYLRKNWDSGLDRLKTNVVKARGAGYKAQGR